MTGEKDPRDVMQAEHDARLSEHPAFRAPAEMPGGEEIARVLAEAQRQKPIPDDVWRGMVESFHQLEGQFPDYANGYSVSTDAFRLARAAQALFAPILAERDEFYRDGLKAEDKWNEMEARALAAEAALGLYRDAVRIDMKMEGPRFMGCNTSALKRAWEADRASTAPGAAMEAP